PRAASSAASSEGHPHADLELPRRRYRVGGLAERGTGTGQRAALRRPLRATGVQRTDERLGVEVRVVDDVEHVDGGDQADLLAHLEGARQPQVPDVGGVRAARVAAGAERTVLQVAVAVVVGAGRDVEGASALERED